MTWIRVIPFDEDETLAGRAKHSGSSIRSSTRRRPIRTTRTTDGIVASHP